MKRVWKFQGIRLECDHNDPATPAMVYAKDREGNEHSSTYECAAATGCVGMEDEVQLTQAQCEWLDLPANVDRVEAAFAEAREGYPEYS